MSDKRMNKRPTGQSFIDRLRRRNNMDPTMSASAPSSDGERSSTSTSGGTFAFMSSSFETKSVDAVIVAMVPRPPSPPPKQNSLLAWVCQQFYGTKGEGYTISGVLRQFLLFYDHCFRQWFAQ